MIGLAAAQHPPPLLSMVGRRHCFRLGLTSFCGSVWEGNSRRSVQASVAAAALRGAREAGATFWFAPPHFRGLSPGTIPLPLCPNTEGSASLEDDRLVTPESFSRGSSVRLASPGLLGRSSSCFRGCG